MYKIPLQSETTIIRLLKSADNSFFSNKAMYTEAQLLSSEKTSTKLNVPLLVSESVFEWRIYPNYREAENGEIGAIP